MSFSTLIRAFVSYMLIFSHSTVISQTLSDFFESEQALTYPLFSNICIYNEYTGFTWVCSGFDSDTGTEPNGCQVLDFTNPSQSYNTNIWTL